MSILPLPIPYGLSVSMFSVGLRVIDARYDKVGANDVQVIEGERIIGTGGRGCAAVDKGGGRRLENIFGGNVSDGDMAVYTDQELYIGDTYAPGEPQRQSFFTYGGFTYRVAGVDPWREQTGINIYLGKRHVAQEII